VSSGVQRLLGFVDRERVRFSMTFVLAAVLCLVLLARSVGWLSSGEPPQHAPTTMEMRLVELAPTPAPAAITPATHPPAAPPPQAAKRTSSQVQAQQQPLTHAVSSRSSQAPTTPPREEARSPTEPATHDRPVAPAAQSQEQGPAQAPAATQTASSATATPSNGTVSSAPPASAGSTQARLVSQPVPVLPDDLREQGYQLTAVARFKVHADGTFDVELIKPTQNPRLNQILLETLHRWRFYPAMENGHPVESDQDVRVHFSVS